MFFLCVTRCPIYHQHTESKCEVCLEIAQVTVEKERSKIKERLTQRGYNSNLIEKQLLKVDELDRKETLKYRKKHKNKKMDRVPLILTYSRALPDIGKILSSHKKIIKKSPQLKKYLRISLFVHLEGITILPISWSTKRLQKY
jgi:hypothetical protein